MNREILEQAFDARFPTEMKDKLRNAFVAIAGLADWAPILRSCLRGAASVISGWLILMWWMLPI